MKDIFWLENWEGECHEGFFIRNDFFKVIQKFEKECNKKVVGIVKPTDWNLELICEDNKVKE